MGIDWFSVQQSARRLILRRYGSKSLGSHQIAEALREHIIETNEQTKHDMSTVRTI
jgi:hypothetical protein